MDALSSADVLQAILIVLIGVVFVLAIILGGAGAIHFWIRWFPDDVAKLKDRGGRR